MSSYTVVVPAYNAAATVREAIQSVLDQSVPPSRIIVVDDGSHDDTAAVAGRMAGPIEVYTQPNQGPGAATTRGLGLVETELVATLDADDLWLPGKIEAQRAALQDEAVAGACCHWRTFRGTPSQPNPDSDAPGWSRTTLFMRTQAARSVGPIIDPPGGLGDMVDWLARVREAGHRLVMLPQTLALRRIHPGSMTYGRTGAETRGYLYVAREALMRRRMRLTGTQEDT